MAERRFALLDRDGTMIVEKNYLSDPSEVELIPWTAEGLREMRKIGLGLLVVTNQSGVGRGYFDAAKLNLIHQRLNSLLRAEAVSLDGIYYCPHTPDDDCLCRKPRTGLIDQAAAELGFDPKVSFVIGDKACDIELGQRIGATTFLVRTGYGSEVAADTAIAPDYVVNNLTEAALVIKQLVSVGKERTLDAAQ